MQSKGPMERLLLPLSLARALPQTFRSLNLLSPSAFAISQCHFSGFLTAPVRLIQRMSEKIVSTDDLFTLTDTTLSNCHSFRGGAVFCQCTVVNVARSTFRANSANYGACIFASNLQSGDIADSAFLQSHALSLCAGFFLDSAVELFNRTHLKKLNHSEGLAPSVGAAECWGGLQLFSFCRIDRCRSTFAHAAVRISSVDDPSVLADTLFTNNTSRQQGCAISLIVFRTLAVVERCVFIDNSQGGTNGTTIFAGAAECRAVMRDCVIYGERGRQFSGKNHSQLVALQNMTFIYDPERDFMKDRPSQTRTPDCKTCDDVDSF
jgi:hypothetical protein